jgi:hypothetical protein
MWTLCRLFGRLALGKIDQRAATTALDLDAGNNRFRMAKQQRTAGWAARLATRLWHE